jgi:hypothetical protein
MGTCVFKTGEVLRCVEHALLGTKWDMGWENKMTPGPALFFVHDQGVYVMSNATQRFAERQQEFGIRGLRQKHRPEQGSGLAG